MATAHREVHKVAHATARIGTDRYHVDIQAGQHRPEDAGYQSCRAGTEIRTTIDRA